MPSTPLRRRRALALLAAPLAGALPWPVAAQERPLALVLGFPPGAGIDALTRQLGERIAPALGRPVIVENRVGAAGRLAAEHVKRTPADGSTLLVAPMAVMTIFPHTYRQLRYDPAKDFVPVAHLAEFGLALAVRADAPARTLQEYVEAVKRDRDMGLYGSTGVGSPSHFFISMFERAAGVSMTHVPHRGSADVMNALLGGHIKAAILTVNDISPQHAAGKLRALAVSAPRREATLPDVPTFKELGHDIEGSFWYGAYAPAGTPAPVVQRLSQALVEATRQPELRAQGAKVGLQLTGGGPDVLARVQKADHDRWGPAIRATGFVAED
ncbi:tripartite tricarboxylate transporter substrate-binding protein [Aquabacterium sp. J223]|uniref:tripartite tricarboxylate transporter substrate-binding protein n=1 Tax=Aquabacterium sp. J223 TaxID=2898431 RepID=UPI0021ADB175|nr:tripartite tricarboxylate transporter substrate-binding protein [Aquabacterium sp. J223]UUX94981.1 ABC transporter substrate-binding protein [Aquabacterium sp. J223]